MAVDKDLIIVMTTMTRQRTRCQRVNISRHVMLYDEYIKNYEDLLYHIQMNYGYHSPNRYYFYSRELYLFWKFLNLLKRKSVP